MKTFIPRNPRQTSQLAKRIRTRNHVVHCHCGAELPITRDTQEIVLAMECMECRVHRYNAR